ncbi:MAG: ComF family protein [Spirochaetes bacterium]|nr:ComF family protein [Spirochaetota bacterium]
MIAFRHRICEVIAPVRCVSCGATVSYGQHRLCEDCFARIEPVRHACPRCSGILREGRCDLCGGRYLYLSGNTSIAEYRGIMKRIIHQYKVAGLRCLHVPLLRLILSHPAAGALRGDVVTAVPLSPRRKWKRGFNQSELVARGLAAHLGAPYREMLKTSGGGEGQKNLGGTGRFYNVLGRYVPANVSLCAGRSILIVDDVFTTGATVNECARVLLDAGAASVYSVTLARAAEMAAA